MRSSPAADPQTSLKEGRPHFGAFRCYDRGFEKEGLAALPPLFRKNQVGLTICCNCPLIVL